MPVFRTDPCGILTICLAYAALVYSAYVVVLWIVLPYFAGSLWGTVHAILYLICVSFCAAVHMRTMVTDPGIIPKPAEKDRYSLRKPSVSDEAALAEESKHEGADQHGPTVSNEEEKRGPLYDMHGVYLGLYPQRKRKTEESTTWTLCQKCDMMRPPRSHHCRTCNGCVFKMDHHCPWINNCVGAYNQKYFLQFLFWIGVASVYSGLLVGYTFMSGECPTCNSDTEPSALMHRVILAVEAALFGMFVLVMLFDQLSSIMKDETGIESLRRAGPYRENISSKALLREVCGTGSMVCWLCPWHTLNRNQFHFADERTRSSVEESENLV